MRLWRKHKEISVYILPNNVSYDLLDELFKDVRFINLDCNKNNPLVKDECWVRGNDSIAYTTINNERAHKVSYEIFKGKKILNYGCHHCDTPACINPNHIFDGTLKQNNWDARRKHRAFEISLSLKSRMDRAEKRLKDAHENSKTLITFNFDSIEERFRRLTGE